MSWNGMFKKYNKRTQVETNVVTQRGINAGGDVVGIREGDDDLATRHVEKIKELYAKNDLLIENMDNEYDRGYEDALTLVLETIEERDGRSGKKQILSDIQNLLTTHREKH